MSETLLLLLFVVIFSAVLGLSVLLWKAFSCLQLMAGAATRFRDRERQDLLRIVEHHLDREMVQKVNPQAAVALTQMHQAEAAHEREVQAEVEKKELSPSEILANQKRSRTSDGALFSSLPDEPFGGVHT